MPSRAAMRFVQRRSRAADASTIGLRSYPSLPFRSASQVIDARAGRRTQPAASSLCFDWPAEVNAILGVLLERLARPQEPLQSKQRRGWEPSRIAPRRDHPESIRFNDLETAPPQECLHVSLRRWAAGPPMDHIAEAMAQPG